MKNTLLQFDVIFIPQEEGGFTAEVPDLPGCISEGETFEETEQNISEAIELYLETLQDRGLPLPEREPTKIVKLQVTVSSKSRNKVHA